MQVKTVASLQVSRVVSCGESGKGGQCGQIKSRQKLTTTVENAPAYIIIETIG